MTVWHELWRWLVVAFPEIINTEEKLRKNKLNSFDKIRGRYVLNLLRVFSYICLSVLLLTKTLHIPYLKRIIPLFKWHIDYIRRRLQHTQKFSNYIKIYLKIGMANVTLTLYKSQVTHLKPQWKVACIKEVFLKIDFLT